MLAKVAILLPLLLCFDQVISQSCNANLKTFFQCNGTNEKAVIIMGKQYECANDTICNSNYLGSPTTCDACIAPKKACGTMFTCGGGNDDIFFIGQSSFKCQSGFACNINKATSCQPCIQKPCVPNWTCVAGEENSFQIEGQKYNCSEGMICNSEEHPKKCSPCVTPKVKKGLYIMSKLGSFQRRTTEMDNM